MTFNKMRFPIVWITLALCVVLCAIAVQCGPVDNRQDQRLSSRSFARSGREESYDDDGGDGDDDGGDGDDGDEEDDGGDEGDDDGDDGDDGDGGEDGGDDDGEGDGDGDEEERSLKRQVREAAQKPLIVMEFADEDNEDVIPITEAPAPVVTTKKPSVLLLLSNALDKAIAATTKLPTQQMASDAAGIFVLLGQVFSEAIDKVIGEDGPEDNATEASTSVAPDNAEIPTEDLTQLPIGDYPVKVEKQPESSQSERVVFST